MQSQYYDPTQEQKITVLLGGRQIQHVLPPVTDEAFLDFLDKSEKLDQGAILELFYDLFVDRLEGLNGALPANWKELLPALEKRDVAGKTMLSVHFPPQETSEVADEDDFSFSEYVSIDRGVREYRLRTYFNGASVTIPVKLRLFTVEEREKLLRVLQNDSYSNRYQTEYSARTVKAALLDPHPTLPVNLLSALAVQHLTADSRVIEKN